MSPHESNINHEIRQPTGSDRHQAGDSAATHGLSRDTLSAPGDTSSRLVFSEMGKNLPNKDDLSKIFGNVSIFDKQGKEVASSAKEQNTPQGYASNRGESYSDSQRAARHHGDLDGQSIADAHGHTVAAPIESAQTKMARLVQQQQQLPGMENMSTAARTSTTLLKSERTRLSAQIEKAEKAQKSNTKRDLSNYSEKLPDRAGIKLGQTLSNGESLVNHDNKLEHASSEHSVNSEQPTQHLTIHNPEFTASHNPANATANRPETTAPHKTDILAHRTENTNHGLENSLTHRSESIGSHSLDNPVSHKSESTHSHGLDNPVSHKSESTGSHGLDKSVVRKSDSQGSHGSDNSVTHKPDSKGSHALDTAVSHKPESKSNPKSDTASVQKSDRKTEAREPKSNSLTGEHTSEKSITQQRRESTAAKQQDRIKPNKEAAVIRQPDRAKVTKKQEAKGRALTSQTNQAKSVQEQNPIRQPDQAKSVPEQALIRQTNFVRANLEKANSPDRSQSMSGPSLAKVGNLKKELSINEERSEKSLARNDMDDDKFDPYHVISLHEIHLANQDHAPGFSARTESANANSPAAFNQSIQSFARSSISENTHIGEPSKAHTINHIVSSMDGRPAKIDSIHITPEPEVLNNNKGTAGGTSSSGQTANKNGKDSAAKKHGNNFHSGSTSTKTSDPVSLSNSGQPGSDKNGQSTNSPSGSNTQPTNNPPTNSSNKNTGSAQTSTTEPGNSKGYQTGSTGTPTNTDTSAGGTTGQQGNRPAVGPGNGNVYGGPIIIEQPMRNGTRQAAFLLDLLAEIGFWAGMDSHNVGRRSAINSPLFDITNSAIPGNVLNTQSYVNQPGNSSDSQSDNQFGGLSGGPSVNSSSNPASSPSDGLSAEQTVYQPNSSNSFSPINSSSNSATNSSAEHSIGLSLNAVVSEASAATSIGDSTSGNVLAGKIASGTNGDDIRNQEQAGANGNGSGARAPSGSNSANLEPKGSPTANPVTSDNPGQLGTNPLPDGNPYLTGSVDYWGSDPGSTSANPGTTPNAATPLPDDSSNTGSTLSGQPGYTGHLEPENAQPGYGTLSGEINSKSEGHNHGIEKSAHRPEISDPWQTTHHAHGHGAKAHDNQLDHKHGQNRHDLLANQLWEEQNRGRKHAHIQPGSEPQNKNNRLPPIKDEILIGQLIGLLTDGKNNKDPKQQARTYVVKVGDTLESIAADVLCDFRLAHLIYIINKAILFSQPDWRQCKLREGLVLFLPVEEEIRCFRLAMIEKEKQNKKLLSLPVGNQINEPVDNRMNEPVGDQMNEENLDHETVKKLAIRRSNIERLLGSISGILSGTPQSTSGREQVTVRLGDTLRSIALKHLSLQDVSLWKLLAQLNELTSTVDAKGVPIAVLTRGMTLQLPTVNEIAEYRTQQAAYRRTLSPRKALQAEVLI